jgi:7-keto-8-aminopelargonate synthetase-like enzyme
MGHRAGNHTERGIVGIMRMKASRFRKSNAFDTDLTERLTSLREQGLSRKLRQVDSPQGTRIRIEGKKLLNFSSNDYLGLSNHALLKTAAIKAIENYGAGAGASRLICGSLKVHHELDECLAAFKGTPAALGFSSGYAAAIGVICALVGKEDILILDKLVHASIIDAARLSGAQLRIFRHNDLADLEEILRSTTAYSSPGHLPLEMTGNSSRRSSNKPSARNSRSNNLRMNRPFLRAGMEPSSKRPRRLIVTESIFSMDGDRAPLREIVTLKEKYGAWLMVDEAHATGLYGAKNRGLAEELGLNEQIEVQMGTLGKAIGAAGGYICGSRALIDFLINRARPFVFSTAPVPAAAAAAMAGLHLVQSADGDSRRSLLRARLSELNAGLKPHWTNCNSHILPLLIGDENKTIEAADFLRRNRIFIPGIRYPTVARGKARLRVTLSANHTRADVLKLLAGLSALNLEIHNELPGMDKSAPRITSVA